MRSRPSAQEGVGRSSPSYDYSFNCDFAPLSLDSQARPGSGCPRGRCSTEEAALEGGGVPRDLRELRLSAAADAHQEPQEEGGRPRHRQGLGLHRHRGPRGSDPEEAVAGGARGSRIPSPPPQIIVLVSFCPFAYFNLKFPPSLLDKKLEKLVVSCLVNFSEVKCHPNLQLETLSWKSLCITWEMLMGLWDNSTMLIHLISQI